MRRNKPGNLAFRTTIIEDTHLLLAAILFTVEANYSIVFFAITNIREKNCRVSIPVKSIIPWATLCFTWSYATMLYHVVPQLHTITM